MIVFFIILMLLYIKNININFKKFNNEYMSRDNTTIINGVFVIIVLFSHFMTYTYSVDKIDTSLQTITIFLGQLMVTTFLFYSGYGIFEKIKKDKESYMNNFLKKRFLQTLINFDIAICLFLILNIVLKIPFTKKTLVLSFIGWDDLGNSNWYMFDIFILYLATWFSFKLFKTSNKVNLLLLTIISIIYIYLLNIYKYHYWCDTMLCFSAGMWYSYFKDKIDKFVMKNNIVYFITLILFVSLFTVLYHFKGNIYAHNILSITFVLIINLFTMKVNSTSKELLLIGQNVFWIYILQRIPMILFKGKLDIHIYFVVCFGITLLLTYILKKLTNMLWNKRRKLAV